MENLSRSAFLKKTALAGAALLTASLEGWAKQQPAGKIRVAIIGCGSVSNRYIPHLMASPLVEVVSLCDIKPERAVNQRNAYHLQVPAFGSLDEQLKGPAFDMLVTLTDMQVHGELNRKALLAGKHVWSEKPMANTYAEGKALYDLAKQKGLRIWGAPAVVNSPQFAFMSRAIQQGKLGRVAAAHGQYGHTGPGWSSFFYEKLGGSMPDLGVYNLATLTGLLGPALSVVAMTSIVNPERNIDEKGKIKVVAEDNAHVLMDHGNGIISHMMCGFNYFDPHGHEAGKQQLHSIQIFGDKGNMRLVGYDWESNGVWLDDKWDAPATLYHQDSEGYAWQEGATKVAEAMANSSEPRINTLHALHVLEIIEAARKSSETGSRVTLQSKFPWPMVK
ncbi:MAG: Gfo/Idh/MocA family oxidoreductase [Chitinophagaceae bacterium]|jgi:predicted dehydrogenase|nr:Gfo/Idh/MocA family oxidoreductase [Chitinophagaceae bacterium]